MGKGSDRGDMIIEGMDNELTQQDMEGVQDDMRLCPQKNQGNEIWEDGSAAELAASRRTAHKAEKT